MDILQALIEAQRGNYQSYELLLSYMQNTPSAVSELVEYFVNVNNQQYAREIVGLFIKNWVLEESGRKWWEGINVKSEVVCALLRVEDLIKVSSLILSSLLQIETKLDKFKILGLVINENSRASIKCIALYVESSRTVPQAVVNYLQALLPKLLETEPLLALQTFRQTNKHIPPYPMLTSVFFQISQLALSDNQSISREAYSCIVEIVSNFYDFISENFLILSQVILKGVNNQNADVSALSLECWNILTDAEKLRIEEGAGYYRYVETLSESIITTLMEKIQMSENKEEIQMFCNTIESVSEIINRRVLLMLPNLGVAMKSQEPNARKCAIYTLGSILAGLETSDLKNVLDEIIKAIELAESDNDKTIKKSALFLVWKLTEVYPEVCISHSIIFELIFKGLQHKPSKHAISALLEIADTQLPIPNVSAVVERLIQLTSDPDFQMCFNIIRSIFEPLKQDNELISQFTPYLLNSLSATNLNNSSISTILRLCFERLSTESLSALFPQIFNLLRTLPFNEEYLICVSCLSRHNLFSSFIGIYIDALNLAFSARETCKSGVLSISELVRNLDYSEWLTPFIPKLLGLLDQDKVPNITIIEALTDILSLHTSTAIPYLRSILNYSKYCMRFSLSEYEDEEFLHELKEVLIALFEGLIQGLSGFDEIKLLNNKYQDIIQYCLVVAESKENVGDNAIAGILGIFSDAFLTFGSIPDLERVKAIVQKYQNSENELIRVNAECALINLF